MGSVRIGGKTGPGQARERSRAVVLNQGQFSPQPHPLEIFGNAWSHLWLSQLGGRRYYWHPVDRGQRCY